MNTSTVSSDQLMKLLQIMIEKNVTHEQFEWLLNNRFFEELFDIFVPVPQKEKKRIVLNSDQSLPGETPIILPIEASLSFSQRIWKGRYDWGGEELINNPLSIQDAEHTVYYEALYFYFKNLHTISSESVVDFIKKRDPDNPWESARAEHLLTFGELFPDEQRKYPIVSLGSIRDYKKHVSVLCLLGCKRRRGIFFQGWNAGWDAQNTRFLAVRKVRESMICL